MRLQLGARVESDAISIDSSNPELTSLTSPSQKDQEFLPISGAAGAIYDFAKDWQLALNLAYSQRAPTAEELFARGPHDATFQFIIGDPNLDVEINRTVDLSLRRTAGRVLVSTSTARRCLSRRCWEAPRSYDGLRTGATGSWSRSREGGPAEHEGGWRRGHVTLGHRPFPHLGQRRSDGRCRQLGTAVGSGMVVTQPGKFHHDGLLIRVRMHSRRWRMRRPECDRTVTLRSTNS